jgi:protein ImuB
VPLALLDLDPVGRDKLARLGVKRVGGLLQLPPASIRQRYGASIDALRKMASGEAELPVSPVPWHSEVYSDLDLSPPEEDVHRLLFQLKAELHRHMLQLAARHSDLAVLELQFDLEDGDGIEVSVRPASPTLDDQKVLELLRLKLETVVFSRGILRVRMRSEPIRAARAQLPLFGKTDARKLDDANHALARLRAEFGDDAVVRIRPGDAHLPEGRFVFEPLDAIRAAEPSRADRPMRLVRRIRERPQPLPRFDEEILPGWLIAGLDAGPVTETWGPYELSGGWWGRGAHRAYHYVKTRRGDLYWVFYDHRRKQWFLHGAVE